MSGAYLVARLVCRPRPVRSFVRLCGPNEMCGHVPLDHVTLVCVALYKSQCVCVSVATM